MLSKHHISNQIKHSHVNNDGENDRETEDYAYNIFTQLNFDSLYYVSAEDYHETDTSLS